MSRNSKKPRSLSFTPAPELDPVLVATAPQAFASVRAEIEAVPPHALIRINVDIPRAARCGLVAAERVEPLLADLAELRRFDVRPVRMLGIYALALLHAHDLANEGGSDLPPLSVLVAEATPLREGLLRTAELLAHYGLVSLERVAAIRRGHGHADLADDLLALGRMFDELWPHVRDKIVAKREDVDRAITVSAQLQKALAIHEAEKNPLTKHQGPRYVRAQAYALFYRAYEETRRGVAFLRWYDGDAQGIVPSLHPRRPRRPDTESSGDEASDLLASSSVTDDAETTPEPERPSATASDALVADA
jgi:hypothetical protein